MYSGFNYQQNSVPQLDPVQSKYYVMMKNTQDLADNNLLENAVIQLNDSDADLLNLLVAEEDILRDITENQFEQLIDNSVMETTSEYVGSENLTRNISELMRENELSGVCEHIEDKINSIEHNNNSNMNAKMNVHLSSDLSNTNHEKYKCIYCQKVCSTKKILKNHIMLHTGIRPYSCDICKKTFRHNYEVSVHKRSHNKPTFQCDICSKMFIHKSHLTSHRRKHIGDFVVICEKCNKGFFSQPSYNHHLKVKHEKIMCVCEVCGSKLSSISALNEHKLTHEPNYQEKRSHICEFCGKSYLRIRHLRSHIKLHDLQLCNYACNICGKSLTTKSNLRKHLANHTTNKKFQCIYCSKYFKSKENLVIHKKTHTGDQVFICSICNKSFSQKVALTTHTRYHTGERPYKCVCGKAFFTNSHLVGHSKTHQTSNTDITFSL